MGGDRHFYIVFYALSGRCDRRIAGYQQGVEKSLKNIVRKG
jgi:hypothetical protein